MTRASENTTLRARAAGTILRTAGRVLLSGVLIAWILWKAPVADAIGGLSRLSGLAIGGAVLMSCMAAFLGACRWRSVLAMQGEKVAVGPLLGDLLVGTAYNLLLPSTVGGDAVRAWRCGRRLGEAHRAWSSVLYERLVGTVVALIFAVPGVLLFSGNRLPIAVTVAVAVLLGVVVLVWASTPLRLLARILARRTPRAAGTSERIAADLDGPLGGMRPLLATGLWSIICQLAGFGILICAVFDWGRADYLVAIVCGVPLVVVLSMVPIAVGGLGLRESLFVGILPRLGVSPEDALAIGLLWLASCLLVAFSGIVVLVVGRSPLGPARGEGGRT